jgi:uncharacterized membrane protein YccC
MLRSIIGILLLVWVASLVFHWAIRSIHIVLLIAAALFVVDLLTRRRSY